MARHDGTDTRIPRDRRSPDGLAPRLVGSQGIRLLPALASLDDKSRAGEGRENQHDPEGLSLEETSHRSVPAHPGADCESHRCKQHQRPGEATQVRLHVCSFEHSNHRFPVAGRSSVSGRSLALRPRLATGLPWTSPRWRMEVLELDDVSIVTVGTWPVGTGPDRLGSQCSKATPAGMAPSRRAPRRIATTMTVATPTPRITSPMLKMLLNGSHVGRAKMSVSAARAG